MKKLFSYAIVASVSLLFMMNSCYYDNAEDLYPTDTTSIDSTTITYQANVKSILETHCAISGCHVSGTGRQPFTTYTEVKNSITNYNLEGRIQDGTMPPGGNIPQADVDVVVYWIQNGTPEN